MYQYEDARIRKCTFEDIPLKIEWINNPENNKFLHYDLPLEYEKTVAWFEKNKENNTRSDMVIEYLGTPVGLVGLLNIDYKNLKAEDYIVVGEKGFKGKGIAVKAGTLNAAYAFLQLGINKLYGYVEVENIASIKQVKKRGGIIEGYLSSHIYKNGKFLDCLYIAYYKENFDLPDTIFWEKENG